MEVFPLVDFRPVNRLIGVDSDERPFLLRLDEAPIVFQLGLIAEELLRGIRRDAAIGGYPEFLLLASLVAVLNGRTVDMFTDTSKRPFFGFSAEIDRIFDKEKRSRPFQIGQNPRFLAFFSRF